MSEDTETDRSENQTRLPNPPSQEKNRFNFWHDLPMWVGMVVSIILLAYAYRSFAPINENFELRERNRELSEIKRNLEENISKNQKIIQQFDTDLIILKKNIKFSEDHIKKLEKNTDRASSRQDKMMEALVEISKNIEQELSREQDLSNRNQMLQSENSKLLKKRYELEGRNSALSQNLKITSTKLKRAEEELIQSRRELEISYRFTRLFILDQIYKRFTTRLGSSWEWLFPPISYLAAPIHIDDLSLEFHGPLSKDIISDNEIRPYKLPKTGKQLIMNELEAQYFSTLPLKQRLKLREDILNFVKIHKDIFIDTFIIDNNISKQYSTKLYKFLGTNDPSLEDSKFNDMIKKLNNSSKITLIKARKDWLNERKRSQIVRESLKEIIILMKAELSK